MKTIKRILILLALASAIGALSPGAVGATNDSEETTTTSSTTTSTTVPPTTTAAPTTTSSFTTVVVTSVVPEGDVPGRSKCPVGEYPQSYAPDAPCGSTDPCLEEGTTLWHILPCATTTTALVSSASVLPKTGSDELTIALCALGFVLVGCSLVLARRV